MERNYQILAHLYTKNYKPIQAHKEIISTWPNDAISLATVYRFYKLLSTGETYTDHKQKSSRCRLDFDEELVRLVKFDPFLTT